MGITQPFWERSAAVQGLRMVQNNRAMLGSFGEGTAGSGRCQEQVLTGSAAAGPVPFMLAAAGVGIIALWLLRQPEAEAENA